jgi:hypothetical protein
MANETKPAFDYETLLKTMNIGLGDGCAGMVVTVQGKRFLLNAVNLDHSPLPISDGQRKYANDPKNWSKGQTEAREPVAYIAKGSCTLETGHQINISAKPVKPRTVKGNGGLF